MVFVIFGTFWARSIQPKFPELSVQNSMDRFGPTGKVSKKRVHLLRWSSFPGRTDWNFGWMDRALCLWPSSKKKEKKTDSRSSPMQALRPFADRFTLTYINRYVNSDGPLVPMVRLILIANDIISMVVLVQNEFAFRPTWIIARYNYYLYSFILFICQVPMESIGYTKGVHWWALDPRGYSQKNWVGRCVRSASENPYPIYDQNLRFSLPYWWPDQKFDALFMTWPFYTLFRTCFKIVSLVLLVLSSVRGRRPTGERKAKRGWKEGDMILRSRFFEIQYEYTKIDTLFQGSPYQAVTGKIYRFKQQF